jgi:hypothetical protein
MKLLLSFVLSVLAATGTHAQESRSGEIPQAVLAALNSLPQAVQAALNSPACEQPLDDWLKSKECEADLSAMIKSISQGGRATFSNSEGAALYKCAVNNNGNNNDKVSDSRSLMSLRAAVRSSSSSSSMTGALAGKGDSESTATTAKPTAKPTPAPTFSALTDETIREAAWGFCSGCLYDDPIDDAAEAYIAAARKKKKKTAVATFGPIGYWDVSKVTNMRELFNGCPFFNEPIGNATTH